VIRMQYLAMDPLPATVDRVAVLHSQSLPIAFITSIGIRFVSLVYSAIAAAPNACVIICQTPTGRIEGFISGTISTGDMFKWILPRYGIRLMWALVTRLYSPSVVRKIVETMRYMGGNNSDSNSARSDATARAVPQGELLSIAVSPDSRKRGVGLDLVTAFESFLLDRSCHCYKVVTHKEDPVSNAFYMAAGFALQRTFEHHGRPMCEYVKHLKA
jgi:GNAT superfamily N-acetyltransferase